MKIDRICIPIFFIAVFLYYMQGWLYPVGSVISKISLLSWFILSLVYIIIYVCLNDKNIIGNTILCFWIMNLIYWMFSWLNVDIDASRVMSTFKNITTVCLSYFPIYVWMFRGTIKKKELNIFVVLLLVLFIIGYVVFQNKMLASLENQYFTNNMAYYFVVLVPLLGLFFNKKIIYVIMAIVIFFVIIGAKRGAIVCLGVELILFIYFNIKNIPSTKKIKGFFFMILGTFLLILLSIYLFNNNEYLQLRLEKTSDGNFSGRDLLYADAFNTYIDGSLLQLLFGYGMGSSIYYLGNDVHNDWLELLMSQGMFGFIMYLLLFYSCINFFIVNRFYMNEQLKFILLSSILVLFIKSIVSMGYLSQIVFLIFMAIAVAQNLILKRKIFLNDC